MAENTQGKLKKSTEGANAELIENLDFFENLEMMQMLVDTGLDKKMKPAAEKRPVEQGQEGKK